MNAPAKIGAAAAVALAGEPAPSKALWFALRDVLDPWPGHPIPREFPPALIEEAQRLLPRYEVLCRPASVGEIREWLLSVLPGIVNRPDGAGFEARVETVAAACAEVPARCFSLAARSAALRKFQFLPGSAEIYALVSAQPENELCGKLSALRRIAAAHTTAADLRRPELAPVDRARAAENAAWLAETRARLEAERAAARRQPKPAYLTPEQLRQMRAARPLLVPLPGSPDWRGNSPESGT